MAPRLAAALFVLTLAPAARGAEVFHQFGPSHRGRIDFAFVGASMTDNTGLANGVNCLKPSAHATVRAGEVPPAPRLVSATLYLGGSLIGDAKDYPDGTKIFDPPQVALPPITDPGYWSAYASIEPAVVDAAKAAAATSVKFRPPGATAPVTVTADPTRGPYVSWLYKPAPAADQGYLAFFLTPIDVTSVIENEGAGVLVGDYEVSGLVADVCYGQEVLCSDPITETCDTVSMRDVNGAASFALLLVYEDASRKERAVSVFEGLTDLARSDTGTPLELQLTLPSPAFDPARGSLAFYALEGDLLIPSEVRPIGTCQAEESIEVNGHLDPAAPGLCLVDDDNPLGNIFNGTLNQEPKAPDQLLCPGGGTPPLQCCEGDGLCGVVGVDIDEFDISQALDPGATQVRTSLRSGQDEVYLGAVVLGIDVFEPTLVADTQVRVIDADAQDNVRIGTSVTYSIAVSNTGNVPATAVHVTLDPAAGLTGFAVESVPPGALDASVASDGAGPAGHLDVSGFDVAPGKVAEIRYTVGIPCSVGSAWGATATVSANELTPFTVSAHVVTGHGPGLDGGCPGLDPDGPFAPREDPNRVLRGGGGCGAAGGGPAALLALALLAARRRRARRAAVLAALLLAAASVSGCGRRHHVTPEGGGGGLNGLDGLPGTPCGSPLMVVVTRADQTTFCIDRFEASLDGGALGNEQQGGGDDTVTTTDGSTQATALVALGAEPGRLVSWYQASAACERAGKTLCSADDWELACRGAEGLLYPYGNTFEETACNGFFAYYADDPAKTGSFVRCVSPFGAYDMSGNVEEWTATPAPRDPGGPPADRAVRGGGFEANARALACAGPEFHAPPGETTIDRGFRCCSAGP